MLSPAPAEPEPGTSTTPRFRFVSLKADADNFSGDGRDPADYCHEIEGSIRVVVGDQAREARIGTFSVYQIDGNNAMNHRIAPHDVYDTHQVTFDAYEALFENDDIKPTVFRAMREKYAFWSISILLINRVALLPKYRGQGLGLKAIAILMQRYWMGAGFIAMKPFPLQFERDEAEIRALGLDSYKGDFRSATAKLRRHYAQLGFGLVRGTPYMVRSTDGPIRHPD